MQFKKLIITVTDYLFSPITFLASLWLKLIRKYNVGLWGTLSPISKIIFNKVGVFPITNHYYEPQFVYPSDSKKRGIENLPGINFNLKAQLGLVETFRYGSELLDISKRPISQHTYSYIHSMFKEGDACVLYSLIRSRKPKRVIEIGCGASSLLIQHALDYNKRDSGDYNCKHTCVEPYENEWLSQLEVRFIKKKVEEIDISFFKMLDENDILFIDSSHIIRPNGDVLFEYLEILPTLNPGVLVHIHDIFTPNNYPNEWLENGVNFWNEQYLLESFLSCNDNYEVFLSSNYLYHNEYASFSKISPMINDNIEPGSFWIRKKL